MIASSKLDFQKLGGVIPEDAARKQLESILPVIHRALEDAEISPKELSMIAVTSGPGLLGSLLVGTTTARAMSAVWNVPLVAVHHTIGHLSSVWLTNKQEMESACLPYRQGKWNVDDDPVFPILTLSISGGHTDLWYRTSHTVGRRLGSTLDDAAGEAFDKGAVMLGLPYPGGPHLMQLAETGDPHAYEFPLPLENETSLDFSFSGLKTSLKYLLAKLDQSQSEMPLGIRSSIAASYQRAICLHLADRVDIALSQYPLTRELHIVGGVAANTDVRCTLRSVAEKHTIVMRCPMDIRSCTDNGAMIAAAGYFLCQEKPKMVNSPFQTMATMDLIIQRPECRK